MKNIITLLFVIAGMGLYAQAFEETNKSSFSFDGTGIYVNSNGYRSANDLTVYPNFDLNLKSISFNAIVQSGGQVDSIDLIIYDDNNGSPGNEIYVLNNILPTTNLIATDNSLDMLQVDLSVDVMLPGQAGESTKYWISPVATVSNTQLVWWELTYASTNGLRIFEHTNGSWSLKGYGDAVYTFAGDLSPVAGVSCDAQFARIEPFEEADLSTHAWTLYSSDASIGGFSRTDLQAHSGTYSFSRQASEGDATSYLVSPPISVLYFDMLNFWYYQHNTANFGESKVLVSTTSNDPVNQPNEFVELISLDDSALGGFSEDAWTYHQESLHPFAGQTVYIAFMYSGGTNMHDLYIDDFEVAYEPLAYNFPESALNTDVQPESTVCDNYDVVVAGSNVDLVDSQVADPGCGNYAGRDLWLKFKAPDAGGVQMVFPAFSIIAYSKVGYALYDSPGTTTPLQCGLTNTYFDNIPSFDEEIIDIPGLVPGNTYYLRIWDDNNNNTGAVYFCLKAYTDPNNAVDELNPVDFSVFPNPAKQFIHINSDENISQIDIYNVSGKKIATYSSQSAKKQLDISSLTQGMYFLKLHFGNQTAVTKFFVE